MSASYIKSASYSEKNHLDRVSVYDLLYKRNENKLLLKCLVTGYEKRIIYNKKKILG